ncbi:MAG: thiaminase II [Acidobacteria bacterium]|nr:thiaminase II [Acidobacteriota bacterium]
MADIGSEATGFARELWDEVTPIFEAILAHPFIRGLTDGSLARESFKFYVIQDALYLRDFARALSILAAKAPAEEQIIMFNEHAAGALLVERSLHESFFRDFGLTEEAVRAMPMAPTDLAYTSYLLSVAYSRPVYEVIAAVLPCYWIYWEVGKALMAKGSTDQLYQRWIDAYAAEEFGKLVEAVLAVTNELAEPLSGSARQAMRQHFITTSRYEWMFWEMGYRREAWPV